MPVWVTLKVRKKGCLLNVTAQELEGKSIKNSGIEYLSFDVLCH
jgi:hypothetical protein